MSKHLLVLFFCLFMVMVGFGMTLRLAVCWLVAICNSAWDPIG